MVRKADIKARSLLVVLTLLAGACSDDDSGDEAATTTTTTSAAPSTATTATSTTTSPCSAPPLGDGVDEAAVLEDADVDGDGAADVVTTYLAPEQWRLRVDLAAGGAAEIALTTAPLDAARIDTSSDIDGDGADELWVMVGTGASTTVMGLYQLAGCELRAVRLNGSEAQFAVGGPVLLLQGVRCDPGGIVHLGATTEDGETYTTLDITYALRDGELVQVDDRAGQLAGDDPALQAYSSFTCGAGG